MEYQYYRGTKEVSKKLEEVFDKKVAPERLAGCEKPGYCTFCNDSVCEPHCLSNEEDTY